MLFIDMYFSTIGFLKNENIYCNQLLYRLLISDINFNMEVGEMSLVQHASSLLLFLEQLHSNSLFSDLQIVCEDGVVDSYR